MLLLHLQTHLAAPVRNGVQLLRQLEVDARILPFLCSRQPSLHASSTTFVFHVFEECSWQSLVVAVLVHV